MKTRTVFALVAALILGAPAAAQAATVPVQQLNGDFGASNSTVIKTPDGVHFGTYTDGGALGGTLIYTGINGTRVSALSEFGYTFTYRQATDTTGAAPYARVFIDADPAVDSDGDGNPANDVDHDIDLDPSMEGGTAAPAGTCPAVEPPQATDLTFNMSTHLVRFDDDAGGHCATSVMTFAQAKAAAGPTAVVSSLNVTQGFSTGQDVSALVRNITVNGTTFAFNVPPVGPPGATTTIIQQVPAGVRPTGAGVAGVQAGQTCRGATVRRIHAPARKGEKLVRVNAALQSPSGLRALKVSGRTITVDLRNRPEANYNVRLIARYRTKSGKIRRVVTRRNLSVACS
jgi:hypothetical protein